MVIVNDILKFIVLVLITFFICQVITDGKKRISYIGTLLICFSTAVVEYINSGLVEALVTGELILLSIHNLLYNSSKIRYLYAIAIPAGIAGFLLLSNISFQISIGIVILILIIWELLEARGSNTTVAEETKKGKKNKRNNTEEKKKIPLSKKEKWILILGIMIALILGAAFYDYEPVQAIESQSGTNYLMNYLYDEYIVFDRNIGYGQNSCLAGFMSMFPMAIVIGVWYIFKEETKHLKFVVPTVIVSFLELILIVLNKPIAFLPNYILVLGFNLLQVYMLLYIFARVEEKLFGLIKSGYVALAGLVLYWFIPRPSNLAWYFVNFTYLFYTLEAYIVLNYSDRRFWRLASWVFTVICLFDFVTYSIVKFV